jgi:ADP-ribose pyrophosphatase YjhB (NUDIX family)
MRKAARAIIIEDDKILVMYRNKHGSEYYTLVGGQAKDDETMEQALAREVYEETGMTVTNHRLVYIEEHPAPYNEQYIFLCELAPHGEAVIQEWSEEGGMNKHDANIHKPLWARVDSFSHLQFRSPQLQNAIIQAVGRKGKGFPATPVTL